MECLSRACRLFLLFVVPLVGGVAGAQPITITELYRDGSLILADRFVTVAPIVGLGPAVSGSDVIDSVFSVNTAGTTEYTSLVGFEFDGSRSVEAEAVLADPIEGGFYVPVLVDSGDTVVSVVGGSLPSIVLTGIGVVGGDGSVSVLVDAADLRPEGGSYERLAQAFLLDGWLLFQNSVREGFSTRTDGLYLAELSTGVVSKVIARGDLFAGEAVASIGVFGLGPDGTVNAALTGSGGTTRLAQLRRLSGSDIIASTGGSVPSGGKIDTFAGQPTQIDAGVVLSARSVENGVNEFGVYLWDGSSIVQLVPDLLALQMARNSRDQIAMLTVDDDDRVVAVIDADGGYREIVREGDAFGGLEYRGILGFGNDGFDDSTLAFTSFLVDPNDPAVQIGVAFRADIAGLDPCPADVNDDGMVDSADFFAWVVAFSNGDPECDQNADGQCGSPDFFAWVVGFNNGC